VGTNIYQQYVQTVFVDNKTIDGLYM